MAKVPPTPRLPFTRATRDALAKYCELRWPNGRRKAVSKEWDLTPAEAKSLVEATASITTIEKVWKHPRGGWEIALPVIGAVIGRHLDQHLELQRRQADERARRLGSLAHELRPACRPVLGDGSGASARRVGEPRSYRR
jgi:hypothetical protein